ncbi:unnamed protein product [Lota lota]
MKFPASLLCVFVTLALFLLAPGCTQSGEWLQPRGLPGVSHTVTASPHRNRPVCCGGTGMVVGLQNMSFYVCTPSVVSGAVSSARPIHAAA